MKKKAVVIAVFALALAAPLAAFAAEDSGKDLCLLNSDNCPNRQMDILQIIAKLKSEIGKGTRIYTPDELNILNGKLASYEYDLDQLQKN
ncbi:hypothetical protein [Geomesophilobacter sediminis]|uniref:Cytochrome C n=1 Tax=Geomesophilobacter sediminis TaxID=2798584 RepID=A0A8J7J4H7_9BACT|nr:hypothetical protein [Geomesophilobacter sediminis]MBJ6725788.1 hypothetical protein [Geomesophilobacter sediminis]